MASGLQSYKNIIDLGNGGSLTIELDVSGIILYTLSDGNQSLAVKGALTAGSKAAAVINRLGADIVANPPVK